MLRGKRVDTASNAANPLIQTRKIGARAAHTEHTPANRTLEGKNHNLRPLSLSVYCPICTHTVSPKSIAALLSCYFSLSSYNYYCLLIVITWHLHATMRQCIMPYLTRVIRIKTTTQRLIDGRTAIPKHPVHLHLQTVFYKNFTHFLDISFIFRNFVPRFTFVKSGAKIHILFQIHKHFVIYFYTKSFVYG